MRILIVRLSSLGDIITSMSVLQFIKKEIPNAQLEWLVDSRFTAVLKDCPYLDVVHSIGLKKKKSHFLKVIYEAAKTIRRLGKFDIIIDMQGLIKSAVVSRLIGHNVVGFDRKSVKEGLSSLLYKKRANISFCQHILKRNFALIERGLNIHVSMDQIMQRKSYLGFITPSTPLESYLKSDQKNILVVLGGSWKSKIYPKELLKEVVQRLRENVLLLWSSKEEEERARYIHERCTNTTLLPRISLNDVKALISKVDLVIGNDTGPTHMAWALERPSVTILGCTSITRIPENEKNLVVTSKVCVNPLKINKNDYSINEIPPFEIVDAANKLL